MDNDYLESIKKQFEYYKMLGEKTFAQAVDGLRAELAEKNAELLAMQKSKMEFQEKQAAEDKVSYVEKEAAVLFAATHALTARYGVSWSPVRGNVR